jgi:hypothetical protein
LLQVLLALASYGVVAFLFNLLDEVRPIFASAPIRDGGLSMSTHLLSWPLSFGGLSFILFVCLGTLVFPDIPGVQALHHLEKAPICACNCEYHTFTHDHLDDPPFLHGISVTVSKLHLCARSSLCCWPPLLRKCATALQCMEGPTREFVCRCRLRQVLQGGRGRVVHSVGDGVGHSNSSPCAAGNAVRSQQGGCHGAALPGHGCQLRRRHIRLQWLQCHSALLHLMVL